MGHAAHFLRRLDRVSDGQVELALTLYRDHALLREVLSRASLPDDAERVAISLDDPVEGPFVVVTREGRFVTCLGAGMLVSGLPIVTRERLDAAAARVERMRERLAKVRALREAGADGQAALAFKRMQQQGPRFAREDAETLLRAQPLIERQCLKQLMDLHVMLDDEAERIATFRLDAPHRLSKLQKRLILAFGDAVWGLAHLLVLVGSSSMRGVFQRTEDALGERESAMEAMARLTFEWGTFTHVSRSLWFVARSGKRALAALKGLDVDDLSLRIYREMALTSIALGSEKLRAEARKALLPESLIKNDQATPSQRLAAYFAAQGRGIVDAPTACEEAFLRMSREWTAIIASPKLDTPSQEECDAIPEEVARIAYVTTQLSIHRAEMVEPLLASMHALPWLVRAEPAELFLPAAWAQRLLQERSLGDVLSWFVPYAEMRAMLVERTPRRAEARPGRNAPCPCGSGKKHKRCCGAK